MCDRFIRAAVVQFEIDENPSVNLTCVENHIQNAKQNGAKLIVLPEYFTVNCGMQFLGDYAESVPDGPACKMLSKAARDNLVYIVGGTVIERDGSNLYNTCTVWNPNGDMIAKYRKIHLFDVNIPDKISVTESSELAAGSDLATFCINNTKIGIGICHDLRFEELARLYRAQGCKILIYPSQFNLATGKLHFDLLLRARAVDNQVFTIGCNAARTTYDLPCWGYSQITSPWGEVLVRADSTEEVLYSDLDLNLCDEVRQHLPIFCQRRVDIYDTVMKSKHN